MKYLNTYYIDQSSMLPVHVSDLRYLIPYRNQSASKATVQVELENRGQILHFSPIVKFRGGVGEISKSILRLQLRTKPHIF